MPHSPFSDEPLVPGPSPRAAGPSTNGQDIRNAGECANSRPNRSTSGTTTTTTTQADLFAPVMVRGRRSCLNTLLGPAQSREARPGHSEGNAPGGSFCQPIFGELPPPPPSVRVYRDVTQDSLALSRVWNCVPQCYEPLFFAARVTLLVTFPLSVLVFHPKTAAHFAGGSLVPVVATANCQLYVGRQLAGTVLMLQTAAWALLWGTITTALGTGRQPSAWWGLCFLGVLLISYFPILRGQRVMMAYGVIIMQMQHMSGGEAIDHSAKVVASLIVGLCFAAAQSLLPVPMRSARVADRSLAACWRRAGAVAETLRRCVWAEHGVEASIDAAVADCDALGAMIDAVPAVLNECCYEPFELSTTLALRRRRLAVLRRLLSLLYTSCSTARLLRGMITAETREPTRRWCASVEGPTEAYMAALRHTLHQLGRGNDPTRTLAACDFEALRARKQELVRALRMLLTALARSGAAVDAPALNYFFCFHLTLTLLAEQLCAFGDEMAAYDPSPLAETWRRCVDFFVMDFVRDARQNLLRRVLLRTNADRRCLMNGVKLGCAFLAAAAFTMNLNADHSADTYYFGFAVITGIGLPTASETLEVGVQRICAMAFSLAVAYVARYKTHTFAQAMAVCLCGTFVAMALRGSTRYMQVAWYASFIIPAAYGISADRVTMIARVVDNSFAVLAYFVICAVLFPVNPIRVLWNKFTLVQKSMADAVSLLASASECRPDVAEETDLARAKLALAADSIAGAAANMQQLRTLLPLCAKEPMIVDVPFPSASLDTLRMLLTRVLANLHMWAFGLELLHRTGGGDDRGNPHGPPMMVSSEALSGMSWAVLRRLDGACRLAFQDMVDCVARPSRWDMQVVAGHLGYFVGLEAHIDAVFTRAHRRFGRKLRGGGGGGGGPSRHRRRREAEEEEEGELELRGDGACGDDRSPFPPSCFTSDNTAAGGGAADAHSDAEEDRRAEDSAAYPLRRARGLSVASAGSQDADSHHPCKSRSPPPTPQSADVIIIADDNNINNNNGGGGEDGSESGDAEDHRGHAADMAQSFSFAFPASRDLFSLGDTAFAVMLVSASTVVSSLRALPPHMVALNTFCRSQETRTSVDVAHFFYMEDCCDKGD